MLEKIFAKKYKYFYFDSEKNQLFDKDLTEKEISKISESEFIENKEYFIKLISICLNLLEKKYNKIENTEIINIIKINFNNLLQSFKVLDNYNKEYFLLLNNLRNNYKLFLNILTNQSWQSPDYGYSLAPQHGIEQEKIYAFYNDYQRYRANTNAIEKYFNNKQSDIGIKKTTYIFNSGMGSLSTLISSFNNFNNSKKIISKNIYFECLAFLKYFPNISFFEENQIEEILTFIEKEDPEYLFFDPVVNSYSMNIFDFEKIFDYYKKNPPKKTTSIIIDTSLCLEFFKLDNFFKNDFPENLNIYLYRSLQKNDQLGLDIKQGGIITHYGNNENMLDAYRQLGTTPEEESIINYEIMSNFNSEERLLRQSRNMFVLAHRLTKSNSEIIGNINHTSLKINKKHFKSYYQTPLLFFSLNDLFNLEDYNFFIQELIKECNKKSFQISLGSSFGFNFIRIMLVNFDNKLFFRLASGMETIKEIYLFAEILNNLIENFLISLKTAYENKKLLLFNSKHQKLLELLNELEKVNTASEKELFKIFYIFKELKKDLIKFQNFKKTKDFYKKEMDFYLNIILKTLSNDKVSINRALILEAIKELNEIVN